MSSVILLTATRYMLPLLLLFSVYLFLRGHNEPGGGFVGGLVAAAAFTLYALSFSVAAARQLIRVVPRALIGMGLLAAVGSGIFPMLLGKPFMTGTWGEVHLPVLGALTLGTPVVFDLGVYLVVVGVVLTIMLTLAEE